MPPILNQGAIIQCSHGGTFQMVASSAPTVVVGGMPVLTLADVMSAHPMTPCPFATAAGPAPCISLTPPTTGFGIKVFAKGQPVLLQPAMFMTIPGGAGVPVPAMVNFPGQVKVQGT
ncbi:MAG TPA: hypothetical protein VH418_05975 [Solirubrobacteraceae bacterium]|jgi:hypothetical protein